MSLVNLSNRGRFAAVCGIAVFLAGGAGCTLPLNTIKAANLSVPQIVDKGAFPPGFLWGAGSSHHQAEGDDVHSDWWDFEMSGRTKSGELSGRAADHWNRYEEDFDLLEQMHLDTFRLSLNWARLFPRPDMTEPDPEAVAHYDGVFQSLERRHIRPMVTLIHFTSPDWVTREDRWSTGAALADFRQFVEFSATRWGKYIDWWITVNEPEVYVFHGWLRGIFPPGLADPGKALLVFANIMRAHAQAYHTIHKLDTVDADGDGFAARVGIAKLIVPVEPYNWLSPLDVGATIFFGEFANSVWLVANQTGVFQLSIPFGPAANEPIEEFRDTLDFLGVNYYSRQVISLNPFQGVKSIAPPGAIVSVLDIEVYPPGLKDALDFASQWNLPIVITENGIADGDDTYRQLFIESHLTELSHFMRERPEVPILGYVHWALTDNFEWENGFGPRFGLVEINYETMQRTMRASGKAFGDLIAEIKAQQSN